MRNDRARQPKGAPTGGQFATRIRPAGQVSLEGDAREQYAAQLASRIGELLPGTVESATKTPYGCGTPPGSLELNIQASTGRLVGDGEAIPEYVLTGFLTPDGGLVEGRLSHSWPVDHETYTHSSTSVPVGRVSRAVCSSTPLCLYAGRNSHRTHVSPVHSLPGLPSALARPLRGTPP